MKRCKQYIGMVGVVAMLLAMGCQQGEVIDRNEPADNTGQLKFSPSIGEAQTATRAAESDNSVLQAASAAGTTSTHIPFHTYTGTPGTSLTHYFADSLYYSADQNTWDSGNVHFLPSGGMHLYAYFATDTAGKGDITQKMYTAPANGSPGYPKLDFTVPTDAARQVDLIAAKVEGITSPDILVPFRHILSQINFGVKGLDGYQIMVKNITLNKVADTGTFDYGTWKWTPDPKATSHTYSYYFPDRSTTESSNDASGANYLTQGTPDDSQNTYIFGDGGKFGPDGSGGDATSSFLYAQVAPSASAYATKDKTPAPLRNSLMLMPQAIKANATATVTFDYEIRYKNQIVRQGSNNTVRLDTYYDWEPNLRYVYIFKFDDPQGVTFDVLIEPWETYNGGDGIVGTDELSSATIFEKYVQPRVNGEKDTVPLGTLISDFTCDWSLYQLDKDFDAGQSFTLSFDSAPFKNGKSIIINPPFGFEASPSTLTAEGDVTFTATYSYFTTLAALNEAIRSGTGNYEFSVTDKIKLGDIKFIGSTNAESSLTLHFLTAYDETLPERWSMFDPKTAVYYPKDYGSITGGYKVYTMQGIKAVFNWMNGGNNPDGSSSTATPAERMSTNITLAVNGKYNLAEMYKADANDSKPAFVPIGKNTDPYTGFFEGNGATVSNLFINTTSYNHDAFFSKITNTVQNLHLTNVSVTSGDYNVSGLAASNGGTIRGCSVSGTITGGTNTGGIVGQNDGIIYSSYSTAAVSGGSCGGVAGYNGATIQACYSIDNKNNVPIIGSGSTSYVKTCYYVAASDIGTNSEGVITRVPSIAALNGKIPQLNAVGGAQDTHAHFVSGNLNATPPSIAAGNPAARANGGVLKGTFIQNWFVLNWDQNRWDMEMALLATIGMEYLVIDQVMEYNEGGSQYMAWYDASKSVLVNDALPINPSPSALVYCMNACRAHGIKLFIGTFFDKRYWDEGAAVKGKETEWKKCITTVNNVMDELVSKYFHGGDGSYNDVLAGWYFPYEVDDLSFQTDAAKTILKDGIRSAMNHRSGNADKPYLFSPFMNGSGPTAIKGTMDASAYAALWKEIITSANGFKAGDILSPQDCIGVGKLIITDLADWMPKLKDAAAAVSGVEFWINVETFGLGGNASFLTGQQIPTSKPYAAKLISFSYPIYYSPNAGAYRQGDHKVYKEYYDAQ